MLEIIKTTQFNGVSKVEKETVKGFNATINTADPENLTISNYVVDYALYKVNREAVAADERAFEDAVYAFQEGLLGVE